MLKKVASIVVALAIIGLFFGLVSFSTSLYAQIPPITLGIKITSPSTGQQVPVGELTISGISTDNVNTDCTVYADINNTKPFQKAVATGPGGLDDYSTWTFTYTNNYHLITNGTNNLTSKLSCIDDSNGGSTANLTKSYSVNVIGVNLDDDDDNRMNVNANYSIPPIVNVPPQPIMVEATNQSGALVNYNVSATDNNDMIVVPICDPPSGSSFSLGNTTVNCTAIDNDGNSAVASFSVIVNMPIRTATTFTIVETGSYNETTNAVVGAVATDVNTCNKNLEISKITAIGDDGDDAIPPNVLDNDLDTRWSHEGIGSWFQADLGAKRIICSADIAWYRGDERSYKFAISISNDGSNFINVYSGTSSGETLSAERYTFSDLSAARYLKITINGNTDDDTELKNWAAITEIDINGYDVSTENKPPSPNTLRLNISGNYEHNNVSSGGAGGLEMDPGNIEGSIAIINSTTNKKIEEYDLAPINIIVTQLFKKITIKTQLDHPLTSGTVNATLNFISPIDFRNGGSYSSTATDRNIFIAEIDGKTYNTKGTAEGKITISVP